MNNLHTRLGRYACDQRGSISVVFGAFLTSMVLGGAAAIDYSKLSSERTRLQGALDASAISGAKARWEGNPNCRKLAEDVLASNYPQTPAIKPTLTLDGEIVRGSVARDVPLNLGAYSGSQNSRWR